MWAKLSNALKPSQAHDTSDTNSPGELLGGVLQQHPNLSVFHRPPEHPGPPPSFTKSSRMRMFKRHTNHYDASQTAPSLVKLPPDISKNVESIISTDGDASPISKLSTAASQRKATRRPSWIFPDHPSALRPPTPTGNARSPSPASGYQTPFHTKSVSVPPVLRDGNTPGTAPNVNLYSRDAYTALSPDQSKDNETHSILSHARINGTPPKEILARTGVDETIFTAKQKWPHIPPALHGCRNSFSLGDIKFYSTSHGDLERSSSCSTIANSPPMTPKNFAAPSRASFLGIKSLLRFSSPKAPHPEPDINGAAASDLLVNTMYHALQTNVPTMPPQDDSGTWKMANARKESKEEVLIFSLKTQLALQTELCGRFETDLRARDELVKVLRKELNQVKHEEAKKKSVLKQGKAELERAYWFQEEGMQGSHQESIERGILDEEISEALRNLRHQIAGLEHDKESSQHRKEMLRAVGTLEGLLRGKSNDEMRLKETLRSRDEGEREIEAGIQEAKREKETMGNIGIQLISENEFKNMAMPKDQHNAEEERERGSEDDFEWEEKEEFLAAVENAELVAELDHYKQRLKEKEDELTTLKCVLEALGNDFEKGANKLEVIEAAKRSAEEERVILQAEVNELEDWVMEMNSEYNEHLELEKDVQELWDAKEAEREELLDQMYNLDGDLQAIRQTLQAREDRIVELSQDRQYALDKVARLEENLRRQDAEATEYSQRTLQREANAKVLIERLQLQICELKQESAAKEVKIVRIATEQRAQDKEDLQGLNLTLDSKQQQLVLLKRRMRRQFTAGSAPAQPLKIGYQRCDSAVFNTHSSTWKLPPRAEVPMVPPAPVTQPRASRPVTFTPAASEAHTRAVLSRYFSTELASTESG